MTSQPSVHLTTREYDVLRMVGAGRSSKQIAASLGIAPKTVETYIDHIKLKMGATNRSHMTALAVTLGLLDLSDGDDR